MASNDPWKNERWLPGVINKRQMMALHDAHLILEVDIRAIDDDASALDLHLSSEAYILKKGSIKPVRKNYKKILSDSYYAEKYQPSEDNKFLLEIGNCYIFKIKERIHQYIKQTHFFGQSTAKSTIGRLDLIARLIVDGMSEYENFTPDSVSSGDLYLEITPITFNVNVREGDSLCQLRFFYGEIENSIIKDKDFFKSILNLDSEANLGTLSVDLEEDKVVLASAFQAKNNIKDPIDLWEKEKYLPQLFWEAKLSKENRGLKSIAIEQNRFYILRSKERISLPPSVCIYCRAMDESLGEMRIHYAGFVHPHFGLNRSDGKEGAPLIFEVRGHNVDVLLTDAEILARLYIYRMSEHAPDLKGSTSYSNQELTLSRTFKSW